MESPIFKSPNRYIIKLNSETRPASAGLTRIGIAECKAPWIETALPVHFHTHEVNAVGFLHHTGYVVNDEMIVLLCWGIEAEHVGHSAASSALYAYAEAFRGVKSCFLHQAFDLSDRWNG